MKADSPPAPARRRPWRVLGWTLLVVLVAAFGWSGWRAYDYRAAVREARAAEFSFEESPTPFAAIRADWRAALHPATWMERERKLGLPDGTDLAPLRPLLLRLDPTDLTARHCRRVDALRGLTGIQRLDLSYSNVKDLAPLAGLAQLQEFYLVGCKGVADLAPLSGLAQLQWLDLTGCTGVADLAPLAKLTRLQRLSLSGYTGVRDLAVLADLKQLQELYLNDCTGLADLAPLAGLAQLEVLDLTGCTGLGAEAVAAFRKSHPQVVFVIGPDGQPVLAQ